MSWFFFFDRTFPKVSFTSGFLKKLWKEWNQKSFHKWVEHDRPGDRSLK